MEDMSKIKQIIEALLIVSSEGLSREEIVQAISDADLKDVDESIELLKEEYETGERSFSIAEIAGRLRVVTKPEYMPWIGNLYSKEIDRLSGPTLETLAILAYKQPVTRAEMENIRGVNVGGILKSLLEKDLILIKGRKDVIGKPLLYGTTNKFLEIFGLNSLDDLPGLRDFTEEDLEYTKPKEQLPLEEEPHIPVNIPEDEEDASEIEMEACIDDTNPAIEEKEETNAEPLPDGNENPDEFMDEIDTMETHSVEVPSEEERPLGESEKKESEDNEQEKT